jgi:predicted metal-dependent phosphoesterase TrpH
MIDLHSHTTASDGQHAPSELLALAHQAGVTCLAVTDHDTVAALGEAKRAADALGMQLVPGIELSAFHARREVHVLGHFVDPANQPLARLSERLRKERHERMEQMVEKMRGLGFPVSMEGVLGIAGDAHLGRPHLARLLVERGFCTSTQDAFDRFLADGGPAWVDRFRLPADEAIALIRQAGGVATLAHPGVSKMERGNIEDLAKAGLGGLEVYHSDHNPSVREKYLKIAAEFDLVPTAGSDFHGEKVAPGRKLGSASMPRASLEELSRRARVSL